MPLQKSTVSFHVENGVDTKTAQALVDGSKFLMLQNAVFDKGSLGQLHKRFGHNEINPVDTNGNPITGGQALATFNATELDLIASNQFYAQSSQLGTFVPKGELLPIGVTERAISENAFNQINADGASLNGIGAYAWEDGRGGVWCTIIDETSGTIFVPQVQIAANGSCPKVISNGTSLFILVSNSSGQIVRFAVSVTDPTANLVGTGVAVGVITSANGLFEIAVVNGYFVLAYQIFVGFGVAVLDLSTLVVIANSNVASSPLTAFAVTQVGTSAMVVTGGFSGGFGFGFVYFFTVPGLSLTGPIGSYTGSLSPVRNIAAIALTSSTAQVWFQQEPTDAADRFVQTFTISTSGAKTNTFTLAGGIGLASQPLSYGGTNYILVVYPSIVQQTYFLMSGAVVVGKFYPLNAGSFSTHSRLPIPQLLPGGNYGIALTHQVIEETVNDKAVTVTGVTELMLDMTDGQITSAQLGRTLQVSSGALLHEYDGASLTEGGFNVFPEAPTVTKLTSNIIIDINQVSLDPSGSGQDQQQIVTITLPSAPKFSGLQDGSQITPGEYFTWSANDNGLPGDQFVVWFSLDGNGSAPAFPGGWRYAQVAMLSTDTAQEMASKLVLALVSEIPTFPIRYYVIGQPSETQVSLVGFDGNMSAPAMNTVFYVSVTCYGLASSLPLATIQLNCCPGYLIRPNQGLGLPYNSVFNGLGFFFIVDGFGDYPPVTDNAPIPVNIGSDYTEFQVANAIALAYTGVPVGQSVTVNGNQVTIVGNENGITTVAPGPNGIGVTQPYSYLWVYERIDAQGQLEQSSPSTPTQANLPVFSGVFIPPVVKVSTTMLRLTEKAGVDLALYRTTADGDIYYRDSSVIDLIENVTTTDYATTTDQVEDADIINNAAVYTTGGVVANDGPPAFTQVIVNDNRVWGITAEDPQMAWFSDQFQTGEAVSWSNAQTMRFQPTGGQLVSLASMDSTLVAFEERQIWSVAGDGPDLTGNGQFSGPTLVSTAAGCRDYASVVLTSNGLIFKSIKGFWLLDRSFQASQIGLDVYAYNADIVSSARSIPNSTQLRFLSVAGAPLMFDYQYGQWGTFTNHQGVSSAIFNDTYYYLRANGQIMAENQSIFTDGDVGYQMLVQTAWLKLNQVQGFGRIWKVFFKGYFPDTNPIQVQTSYNYLPAIIDTKVWNPSAGTIAPVWGSDPVWGSSTPWGGVDSTTLVQPDTLQIRYDPKVQACEAMQLTIQDLSPFPSSVTWSLDAIDIEVGVRKGGFKIGTQQRIG
jgi:hypothetical protein